MNILCLHGRNQSGKVFETQLAAPIQAMRDEESSVSFDFADGPIWSPETPVDKQATYKFFENSNAAAISKAHEWLGKKLESDGPYDGVIGFSDGATLVSSYLQHRQWYSDEESQPFKFAIFISAGVSLSVLGDLGACAAIRVVQEAELRCRDGLSPLPAHASQKERAMYDSDHCFGLNLNRVPREFKIRIPTVHVWGTKDPCFPAYIHLVGLCDPYIRQVYQHHDAHEVPQKREDTDRLGPLFVWCMRRAVWPGQSQV
ncbi:serine hydrolase FSH [Xylaria intraflava]|nr:serine hydrolase FSH [Xylaria intraflava]